MSSSSASIETRHDREGPLIDDRGRRQKPSRGDVEPLASWMHLDQQQSSRYDSRQQCGVTVLVESLV